jgi:adenylate cyclase
MPIEIERRFLVCSDEWRNAVIRSEWRKQSYLARTSVNCVRVRRSESRATITVKSGHFGLLRDEFEYRIPILDADHMLERLCVTPILEKVRHWVEYSGMVWEVDVYGGEAAGLVLAEIELQRPDQPFALPRWVSAEVTEDPRYRSRGIALGLWRETAPEPQQPRARSASSRATQVRTRRPRRSPRPRV